MVGGRSDSLSTGRLVIRADADARIGGGHLMRCLALAEAWQSRGGDVTFLSNCSNPGLLGRIESAGMNVISLAETHPAAADLRKTLSVLEQRAAGDAVECWLAIDGYHFSEDYQQAIRKAGRRLLVIDDMAHLTGYHADLLINQNLHAETLHYRCDSDTELLLGTQFVMLRSEFQTWSDWRREIPQIASKIVVSLGGGDADNVTLKVLQALLRAEIDHLQVRVIVGPANKNLATLEQAANESANIQVLSNVTNMPEQFAWADLAVSAAGSTCWELAFMGLPAILIAMAKNQEQIAQALEADEMAVNLGSHEKVSTEKILRAVQALQKSSESRREMSVKARKIVDGKGSLRVVDAVRAKMKLNHAHSISG